MQEDASVMDGELAHEKRAEECVRLANLTTDQDIKRELLTLRQVYLRLAERVRALAGERKSRPF